MNHLIVEKVVYRFQDLVSQKRVKTFTKFLGEINIYFKISDVERISYKFICNELKNIHAFLKEIQHHPNSHLLSQALKPLFGFLLNNLVIPKVVIVGDEKFLNITSIRYLDLVSAAEKKRVAQVAGNVFVILYKGKTPLRLRENVGLLPDKNWVFKFVMKKMEKKCMLSMVEHGMGFFNFEGWSDKQISDFGTRLGESYFSSDSKYLPREFFDMGEPDVLDIPEGH